MKVFRLDIVPEQAEALAAALGGATDASLFHPSIVEPIAAGVQGTLAYRAEEYVAAESLDVAMRHYAPAPLDKTLPFITQLAGAIDFARAAGVGHGGLHPRDIFVTPDDARATGFGVVEALERVGIRAPVRRPYTAPERIDGQSWGTPADVFSLAAITFELLTGRRPAGTGVQIGALPEGEHQAAMHAVLARAMDDNPARRYSSALAFAGALESAGRGESESATLSEVAAIASPQKLRPPEPAPAPEPARPPVREMKPTPGEFAIEEQLNPRDEPVPAVQAEPDIEPEPDIVVAAPASIPLVGQQASEPTLYAHDEEPLLERDLERDEEPALDKLDAELDRSDFDEPLLVVDAQQPARFADEFTDDFAGDFTEEQTSTEARRPLEAVHETVAPALGASFADDSGEPPMFDTGEPERPRTVILPASIGLVVGLLIGFAAGSYVMSHRDRAEQVAATAGAPPATAPAATPPAVTSPAPTPSAAAPAAATHDTPGQYSEQKVTPPATSPAPPAAAAKKPADVPGVVDENRPARSNARPSAPAATSGSLAVRSTPAHAGVVVNGKWRGRTPLTLDRLTFGRYIVRVVQPGFKVAQEEFALNARDADHTFTARLEPTAKGARGAARDTTAAAPPAATSAPDVFTGSLYVDSRPRGATVLVDGKSIGQTPLSVADVAIGEHVIRIELAGKKPWSTTARVVAGQMARVTGSLEDSKQ